MEADRDSRARASARPTVIGLPEGLASTVAPARTASMPGARGTHRSSQISMPTTRPGTSCASNRRSVPKGIACPPTVIVSPVIPLPEAKWRFS